MTTFKICDRVRLRGSDQKGTAREPTATYVRVEWDHGIVQNIHPELLIRLKPKAKLREFWITYAGDGEFNCWEFEPKNPTAIHVREVRSKGKK